LKRTVRRRAFFPVAQSHAIARSAALRKPRDFGIHLHFGSRLAPTGGAFGPALVCGQTVWVSSSACAPAPIAFMLSLSLMDLTFFYWHLANHRVPFLWRFHNVRHLDPDLDVSTAFRFHFCEIALSIVFRLLQVSK